MAEWYEKFLLTPYSFTSVKGLTSCIYNQQAIKSLKNIYNDDDDDELSCFLYSKVVTELTGYVKMIHTKFECAGIAIIFKADASYIHEFCG